MKKVLLVLFVMLSQAKQLALAQVTYTKERSPEVIKNLIINSTCIQKMSPGILEKISLISSITINSLPNQTKYTIYYSENNQDKELDILCNQ